MPKLTLIRGESGTTANDDVAVIRSALDRFRRLELLKGGHPRRETVNALHALKRLTEDSLEIMEENVRLKVEIEELQKALRRER